MQNTRRLDISTTDLLVTAAIQTDAGCLRESNEDSGRHVSPGDAETLAVRGRLTIVADGMGGHASGEVASQMAVEIVSKTYYSGRTLSARDAIQAAVSEANSEIYEASVGDEGLSGMGTTLVALVVLGSTAFWAHVGDSRLYRMRAQHLELMTMDHSQVMEMVQNGVLTMDQARNHEDKNVILRALGTQPTVEIDVSAPIEIEPGDTFLLCSDGLNDMLDDKDIETILASETDEYIAGQRLITAAKEKGGHDNVTVGVVRVGVGTPALRSAARITREVEAV
jgi:serine/threonine protein phosphatase PrpC